MTYRELIEALEKAEGPTRELDDWIDAVVFGGRPSHDFSMEDGANRIRRSYGPGCVFNDPDPYINGGHVLSRFYRQSEPVTSSLDATIYLCNKALPGWIWRVATCSVSDDAWVMPDFNCPIHGDRLKSELPAVYAQRDPLEYLGTDIDLRPSGRPAIALVIAILTALENVKEHQS